MTIDGYVLYQQLSHRIWEKQWISSDFPWRNDPILPTMDVMDNYWMTKFVVPTESEINSGLTINYESTVINMQWISITKFLQFLQWWNSSAGHQKPAKLVASPLKFSATPASYRSAPPQLGEHTEEVLNRAGFSDTELEELKKNGVLEDEHMGKWWEHMLSWRIDDDHWDFFHHPLWWIPEIWSLKYSWILMGMVEFSMGFKERNPWIWVCSRMGYTVQLPKLVISWRHDEQSHGIKVAHLQSHVNLGGILRLWNSETIHFLGLIRPIAIREDVMMGLWDDWELVSNEFATLKDTLDP